MKNEAPNTVSGISPFQNTHDYQDGTRICSGAVEMGIPQGGNHVRQVFIDLPLFAELPFVSVELACLERDKPEMSNFAVYDITLLLQQDKTVLKISAQNLYKFVASELTFVSKYIVTGRRP